MAGKDRSTYRGVLLPVELRAADVETLDAYAEKVKAGNAAFVRACFALEDAAARIAITMDVPEDTGLEHGPMTLEDVWRADPSGFC